MSTQNTAPDFGEPWQSETGDFEIIKLERVEIIEVARVERPSTDKP